MFNIMCNIFVMSIVWGYIFARFLSYFPTIISENLSPDLRLTRDLMVSSHSLAQRVSCGSRLIQLGRLQPPLNVLDPELRAVATEDRFCSGKAFEASGGRSPQLHP